MHDLDALIRPSWLHPLRCQAQSSLDSGTMGVEPFGHSSGICTVWRVCPTSSRMARGSFPGSCFAHLYIGKYIIIQRNLNNLSNIVWHMHTNKHWLFDAFLPVESSSSKSISIATSLILGLFPFDTLAVELFFILTNVELMIGHLAIQMQVYGDA